VSAVREIRLSPHEVERERAHAAVLEMVNRDGRPEASKVAMLRVVQRLVRAERAAALAEARDAVARLS
jgi:hypothetical protein